MRMHSIVSNRLRSSAGILPWGVVVMAVAASSAWVTHAFAAPVRGTLEASTLPPVASKKAASYWQEWNGVVPPRPMRPDVARRVTVFLTGAGPASAAAWKLVGGAPFPETVVVAPGQDIQIENTDIFDHQLFAEGMAGFESLQTASGNSRKVRATTPGTWTVRDAMHGDVKGYVAVVPGVVAVANVDDGGRFSFASVEPGQYVLHVFYRGKELTQKAVTVAGNREVNVGDLSLVFPADAP